MWPWVSISGPRRAGWPWCMSPAQLRGLPLENAPPQEYGVPHGRQQCRQSSILYRPPNRPAHWTPRPGSRSHWPWSPGACRRAAGRAGERGRREKCFKLSIRPEGRGHRNRCSGPSGPSLASPFWLALLPTSRDHSPRSDEEPQLPKADRPEGVETLRLDASVRMVT